MNAAAIRLLADKGLDAAAIAEVAEALESKPERSKAAERQARYRARKKEAEGVTSDVTCDASRDVTDSPLPLSPNENNSNPHTPAPVYKSRARKGGDFPQLDCSDDDTWRDFLKNRKAKRLPNTATAHAKLKADLARVSSETGWPPGEVFSACVAKGWGAIYDPRDNRKPANDRPQPSNRNAADLTRAKLAALRPG